MKVRVGLIPHPYTLHSLDGIHQLSHEVDNHAGVPFVLQDVLDILLVGNLPEIELDVLTVVCVGVEPDGVGAGRNHDMAGAGHHELPTVRNFSQTITRIHDTADSLTKPGLASRTDVTNENGLVDITIPGIHHFFRLQDSLVLFLLQALFHLETFLSKDYM